MYEKLICPVCGAALCRPENSQSLYCNGVKRHCYDIASSGHLNLALGHTKGGDSAECVKSRSAFLGGGYYQKISDSLNALVEKYVPYGDVIDAGCGEGYYTNRLAALGNHRVYGFDLSKPAVEYAAKSAKRNGIENALFAVAGIYSMPMMDNSADAVINIFAPCAETEFRRVLKKDGYFFMVYAGEDHLLGLKKALYENAYKNEKREDEPCGMIKTEQIRLKYTIDLKSNCDIMNLFSMTPYFYRTSLFDKGKLAALTSLSSEVDVIISVYKNNG